MTKKQYTIDEIRHEKLINSKIERQFCKGNNKGLRKILSLEEYEGKMLDTIFTKEQLERYIQITKDFEVNAYTRRIADFKSYQDLFNQIAEETNHTDLEIYLMFIYLDTNLAIKTKYKKPFEIVDVVDETQVETIQIKSEKIDVLLGIDANNWDYPITKWNEVEQTLITNMSLEEAAKRLKMPKLDISLMALDLVYGYGKDLKCYFLMNQILWDTVRTGYEKNKAK